jgi:Protein of unknown function (DUF2877)
MRPVDVGVDAARMLRVPGPGVVRAVFPKALYLRVPGGLLALATTEVPRGPLHLRVDALPAARRGGPVLLDATALRVGGHDYRLDAPVWSPLLPPPSSLDRAADAAARWLPELAPRLDLGPAGRAELPAAARTALRRGDLLAFAASVWGSGPGLTPAGDDVLAGVLLVARATCGRSGTTSHTLRRCADEARTNEVARAFLACAARGRSIEPAHDLLLGLAAGDRAAVRSAVSDLRGVGSSSGAALTYGIRIALLSRSTLLRV